jgi:hypothetical protein
MKIEVLYVPGCPNYQPALDRVQRALAAEALAEEIHQVRVNTLAEAKALLFPGSPTIRVNGVDVEPQPNSVPGLACRLYADRSGVPSQEAVRTAISQAKGRE